MTSKMLIVFSCFALFAPLLMSQAQRKDRLVRYIPLKKGQQITVVLGGMIVTAKRTERGLEISSKTAEMMADVMFSQNLTATKDDEQKIWTFYLTRGKVSPEIWKDMPLDYHVVVHTPLGIFMAKRPLFWESKSQRLTDKGQNKNRIRDFKGFIEYTDTGIRIVLFKGAGIFQLYSGEEMMFHKSGATIGVQFSLERPYPFAYDALQRFIDDTELPADDPRDKTPGQS